jgi:tRNA(fMet)-specific endonuclease VapC
MFLLDTNICIFLLNQSQGHDNIIRRMDGRDRGEVGISGITVAELHFGVAASGRRADNAARLERFLAEFEVLPFDHVAARAYGRARAELRAEGTPIGPMDMLIAGHALGLSATVVTNNVAEFQRVSGLRVEDWTKPL